MAKKITLAHAERVARAVDPVLWDSLTPAERRAMVATFNAKLDDEAKADAFIRRTFPKPKKRGR